MKRNIILLLGIFLVPAICSSAGEGSAKLTFAERVAYQSAIEEVHWAHSNWPKENTSPKPSLEEVTTLTEIASKVEDYLRKSDALGRFWNQRIQPEQLQAEVDRMVGESKDPSILNELFKALGNNPYVIAECLARPILADRLIRDMYAGDERLHQAAKDQAKAALSSGSSIEGLTNFGGIYQERVWKIAQAIDSIPGPNSVVSLDIQEYEKALAGLREKLGRQLPQLELSPLQEDANRFYTVEILEKSKSEIRIATVEWKKQDFKSWWNLAKNETSDRLEIPAFSYRLAGAVPTADCSDHWTSTFDGLPTSRYEHSAIWTGTEMIVWGGTDGYYELQDGARYNPATNTWSALSLTNAPAGRYAHSAVWTGTHMIVWGGNTSSSNVNDGAKYDPASDSWLPISSANAPSPRYFHGTVWTGTEMIVWGGSDGNNPLNSGGRYNPATDSWNAAGISTINAPTPRSAPQPIWTGNEMILWGGAFPDYTATNTGGRYNPSTDTWVSTSLVNAPAVRFTHSVSWTGSEMIVWGGHNGTSFLNTGGRYNPVSDAWTTMSVQNAPLPRQLPSAIWTGTKLVVWGGCCSQSLESGGLYDPQTDSWGVTNTFNSPPVRFDHTEIWTGSEMIVWGGHALYLDAAIGSGGRFNPQTNQWSPAGTSSTSPPTPRSGHSAVWTGNEMIIWGGHDLTSEDVNSGGRYAPATNSWSPTDTLQAPSLYQGHVAIWTGTQMLVWGDATASLLEYGKRYNPFTDSWSTMSQTNAPPPRNFSPNTGIWTGSELLVWGGMKGPTYYSSGGRYNPSTDTWQTISSVNEPAARTGHTAVWTGNRLIVWGGSNGIGVVLNTGGMYDPSSNSWSAVSTFSAPAARDQHVAAWTGSEMLIWGADGIFSDTGGRYNPSTNSWVAGGISTTNAPDARRRPSAVWDGNQFLVWGGFLTEAMNSGAHYDPIQDTWTTMTTDGAPSPRSGAPAVWTGTHMIVWGGGRGGSSGGLYGVTIAMTPGILSDAVAGVQYDQDFSASGGTAPYTFALGGTVPPGMNFSSSGNISGVPTTIGVFSFDITANDASGCSRTISYILKVKSGNCNLFCDSFDDGILNPNWSYQQLPWWSEDGDFLIGQPARKKAVAIASPIFSGCLACSVTTTVLTGSGSGNKTSIFGWYKDKKNAIELLIKQDSGKILLKQRVNGVVVAKAKAVIAIAPATSYVFSVAFDNSDFSVSVDGTPLLSLHPVGSVPVGTVGFQVTGTGRFDDISVE